jgi:hypothetical protein
MLVLAPLTAHAELVVKWDEAIRADADLIGVVQASAKNALSYAANGLGMSEPRLELILLSPDKYRARFGERASQNWWAHYYRGQVYVNAGITIDGRFAGLLAHEMTHAVLDKDGRGGALPGWLNEGLAEYFRYKLLGRPGVDDVQRIFLKDAERAGDLRVLPQGHRLSANDYLASYAAITFMIDTYGKRAPFELAMALLKGESASSAATSVLHTSLDAMERAFFAWIRSFSG